MHVFVINLEKDTARKAFMEQQLQSLGLPYEFINATNGHSISDEYVKKIYSAEMAQSIHGHQLSRTQIGCADSHRRVYERMKVGKMPWALILEDDVILDKKILSLLNDTFIQSSRADWLQIDYPSFDLAFIKNWWRATKVRTTRQPVFILYAIIKLPILLIWGSYEYLRELWARDHTPIAALFPRPLYLTGAYIITARGVQKVLPLCTPIRFGADELQNKARVKTNLVLRGIVPMLARQDRNQFESNLLYDNQ